MNGLFRTLRGIVTGELIKAALAAPHLGLLDGAWRTGPGRKSSILCHANFPRSRYRTPHQGHRECERRRGQLAKAAMKAASQGTGGAA